MLFIHTKYYNEMMLTRHVECIWGPTDLDIRSTKYMLTLNNRLITPACHTYRDTGRVELSKLH